MAYKFETIQLHGGQHPDSETGSRAVPIYQTSSYVFKDSDHAARLFSLEEAGNIYTRLGNPTTAILEERVALLEGGVGALAVASGAAAVAYTFLTIAKCGDEILSASNIYGGTYNFLANTIKDYGVESRFFNPKDLDELRALITSKTKVI
ncbi:MAG: PLP-dependent transferase, partial [Cetobacterium sp.]